MVAGKLRGLFILNTAIFGFMLLYILVYSITSQIPTTTNEIIFISIILIDIGLLLYKSGTSLNEYEKYFSGLGTGISGCILSALGLGIIQFLGLTETYFYIYGAMILYCLFTSILYIMLNEMQRSKKP